MDGVFVLAFFKFLCYIRSIMVLVIESFVDNTNDNCFNSHNSIIISYNILGDFNA